MIDEEQVRRLLDRAAASVEPGPLPRLRTGPRRGARWLTAGAGATAAAAVVAVMAGGELLPSPVSPPGESPEPTPAAPRVSDFPDSLVPDVLGRELGDALAQLEAAGLTGVPDPEEAVPEAACSATVYSSVPEAGSQAARGSTVVLRFVHEPCLIGTHTLTGDALRLTEALQEERLGDVSLAPVVRLTQEGGPPIELKGAARFVPDNWVVWTQNALLPLGAAYDQAVVSGTPLNCTGSVDALPAGETNRPDLTLVDRPDADETGEQDSCLAWSAIDLWLDADGALRHVHLRTWE